MLAIVYDTDEKNDTKSKYSYLRMEVDHGCRLYVLLPKHLHLHWCIGELIGEVVQEVWEVRRRSVDDTHHKTCSLALVLAERQGNKLLGETLHLCWRQTGELLAVGVRHRRPSIGLLLKVDQMAKLKTRYTRRRGTVERGAVAQPVSDHGWDGGSDRRILMVLLWCCGVKHTAAADAIVPVNSVEELGQTQRHSLA